jgi:hypothetical protein
MNRRIWLLVAALAALSLAFGTGGFSAAELNRGLSVSVADDPADGYVGIEYIASPATVEYGSNDASGEDSRQKVHLLTLRNNLVDSVYYTVRVQDPTQAPPKLRGNSGPTYELGGQTGVGRGERVRLSAPVVCAGNADQETWTLHITAESDGVTGELTREVTIECEKRTPSPTSSPTPTPETDETENAGEGAEESVERGSEQGSGSQN